MTNSRTQQLRWRNVRKRDLSLLRERYLKFDPYSDFNTTSLWGYMGTKAKWTTYGDATIYKLLDYNDGSEYLSILGEKDSREALTLLSRQEGLGAVSLFNVPEVTKAYLENWDITTRIEADHTNHDYILSVSHLVSLEGGEFKSKRKLMHQMERRHPGVHVEVIDHRSASNRRLMYKLFRKWVAENNRLDYDIEYAALKRELNIGDDNMVCVAAFDKKRLIGFTVNELDGTEYYQAHFGKTRHSYKGLSILLEHHTAKIMHDRFGVKYMNLQQDLGISGLGEFKKSLGPTKLLKKYSVELDFTKLEKAAS